MPNWPIKLKRQKKKINRHEQRSEAINEARRERERDKDINQSSGRERDKEAKTKTKTKRKQEINVKQKNGIEWLIDRLIEGGKKPWKSRSLSSEKQLLESTLHFTAKCLFFFWGVDKMWRRVEELKETKRGNWRIMMFLREELLSLRKWGS